MENENESEIEVLEVTGEVDDVLVRAMRRLIPQLSRGNPPPGRAELDAMVDSRLLPGFGYTSAEAAQTDEAQ